MSLKDALSPVLKEYPTGGGGGGGGLEDYDFNADTITINGASTDATALGTKGNRFVANKDLLLTSVTVMLGLTSFTNMVYKCCIYIHGTETDEITDKFTSVNEHVVNYSLLVRLFTFPDGVEIPEGTIFDVVIINTFSTTSAVGIAYAAVSPPAGSLTSGAITHSAGIRKAVAELGIGDSLEATANTCVLQTLHTLTLKP